ncbi:MAG: hypothetical protein KC431_08815 [Myxococcales bacterium]|nr:hypothetical protein [Myxococcales bacterium]
MRRAWVSIAPLLPLLPACKEPTGDYELPAGWEQARHIDLAQSPATDGCGSEAAVTVEAGVSEGRLQVVVDDLMLSCGEAHEGFIKARDGGGWDLLLQPVDMHPPGLAGCGCASRLRGDLGDGTAGTVVDVYRRGSLEENPAGTVDSVGSAAAADMPAGCDALEPCDGVTPCANAGNEDPDEYWEQCISLAACGGAVCVSYEDACMIRCGELECAILESYPEQVSCFSPP